MRFGIFAMLLGLTLFTNVPGAQEALKPKELQWTHAFDLACRRYGELDFTKETQKLGIEAFKDNNNGLGLYISQVGSLAAGGGFQDLKLPLTIKGPEWFNGLDLPARKAGEEKFETAKVHSLEVFRDPNTANWIYITEKGDLAVSSAKAKTTLTGEKGPKWLHSVDLNVRKGGVKAWKDALPFGIEVYRDNANGNLVYISETGAIAVLPDAGDGKTESEGKAPEWVHGLDLKCRRHNEPDFTSATRKFGVEVFLDTNNGNLIFLCETGTLAVTPSPKNLQVPTAKAKTKEPDFSHGLNIKTRKYGEREFSDKTTVFGAECFRENNLGVILYIGETGALAAVEMEPRTK